ncbi:MAG: T9SS type A sorting domain-containing protein [FCB group bacterium]|nr:T9SS type A sorting domain-containing protein [FCB group bacterium]
MYKRTDLSIKYFAKRIDTLFVLTLLLFISSGLYAGIPGYYFHELTYAFAGRDSVMVNSQKYTGADGGNQRGLYGMLIDPEGKRWFGFHSGFSNEFPRGPGDTLQLAGIRCFLPDGSEAAFSPLEFITFPDDSRDTLYLGSSHNGACRGISLTEDGHILYTARSSLYKIDHRDGSGIARWHPGMYDLPVRTFVKAAHDPVNGHIYIAPYPQQESVYILSEDLALIDTAITRTPTLQNAMIVRTHAGVTRLYSATHANGQGIFVYESADPGNEPFVPVDTLGNYSEETDTNTIFYTAWPSSLDWLDRDEGIILFGNDYRAITTVSSGTPPPSPHAARWFVWDVNKNEMIAMFGAPWYDTGTGDPKPKAVSELIPQLYLENQAMVMRPSGAMVDGNRIFISDIELNCVQEVRWSQTGTTDRDRIPGGFALYANYPNPFNPLTTIPFYLDTPDHIVIDIRTLSGRKVRTLYSGKVEAGRHQIVFDADGLASGVYLYSLSTSSFSLSRKMTLLR